MVTLIANNTTDMIHLGELCIPVWWTLWKQLRQWVTVAVCQDLKDIFPAAGFRHLVDVKGEHSAETCSMMAYNEQHYR